jgi:hypothetical protein
MSRSVVFFDLWGTLLRSGPGELSLAPGAEQMLELPEDYRLGVLCNVAADQTRRDVIRALEETRIALRFHRELIIAASDLPVLLPDHRAFAVAAALAELPLDQCVYVSASVRMRIAAAAAGMRTVLPDALSQSASAALLAPAVAETSSLAFSFGEVDEDTGPTFALRGRVVTMNSASEIISDGRVIVRRGKIVDVSHASEPLPPGLGAVTVEKTNGTIYPGLIDLHNHFTYNVLPLWVVPLREGNVPFQDRSQWPRHRDYKPFVTAPLALMATHSPTAEAIVRYVEAKAIVGGTTTGQGIRGKSGTKTTPVMYRGAMRNVEETNDPRLPEARTLVPDLQNNPQKIADFRRALDEQEDIGGGYFYHLAEGSKETARKHYLTLLQNDLLRPALIGIHSLGLEAGDLRTLAQRGAKIVWSPYSNLLLYRKQMNVAALRESGAVFSIGCDWTPTGSRNLLFELKVARHLAGTDLSSEDLVRAVTAQAARVAGWDEHLGVLRKGALADLVVINGETGDEYDHLIDATEPDVRLVVIHGVPRYGDKNLMQDLPGDAAHPAEALKVGAASKLLCTFTHASPINHLTLKAAQARLEEAMGDLPAFRDRVLSHANALTAGKDDGRQGFTLILDNEYDETAGDPSLVDAASVLAAVPVELPQEIELDRLTPVSDNDYWERVGRQPNLPQDLKDALREAYVP